MSAIGTYLQYQSYSIGTSERFIYDLFSSISPRWYPNNIINSTGSTKSLDVYNIFEMYAQQFASASTDLQETYNNLFIETVSTGSSSDTSSSFIYNNFGAALGVGKIFLQDYETFSTSSVLMSYRQQLRMLIEAFYAGASYEGIQRVGQSFTGISPIITQYEIDRPGWNLTTISGSVLEVGEDFFVGSNPFERSRYIFPNSCTAYVSGSGYINTTFSVGDNYHISYSKLGINTKIYSSNHVYGSSDIYAFVATGSTGSVQSSLTSKLNNVLRADMSMNLSLDSNFVYDKPQSGSVGFFWNYSSGSYVYNNQSIVYGAIINSNVLQLPVGYSSYDWYYDWAVLKRNDAYYQIGFRTYSSSSIPSSVYFMNYDPSPVPLLPFSTGSLYLGSHYLVESSGSFRDVSGFGNNLKLSTGSQPILIRGRNTSLFGNLFTGSVTSYTGSTSGSMNFGSGSAFYCEMWVRGLDTSSVGNFNSLIFKNQSTVDTNTSLAGNGYGFRIGATSQTISLSIYSGSLQTVSASISPLFQELPNRYHYLGYTWISGSVYLYLDGQTIGTGSLSLTPPNTGTGNTSLMLNCSGSSIGIDELVVGQGFLDSSTAFTHFTNTKSKLQHIGIPSGSVEEYHQMQLIAFASGSGEIEYHQFSLRGIQDRGLYIFDPKRSDLIRYPIFKP